MSRVNPQQGLLPSIFDRLIDPQSSGSAQRHGYTEQQMYYAVLRDLEELLNTRQSSGRLVAQYEELSKSIFTYGLPDFGSMNPEVFQEREAMERTLAEVISRFEPRLKNVQVCMLNVPDHKDRSINFRIEAHLNVEPAQAVAYETKLDPPTGSCSVE